MLNTNTYIHTFVRSFVLHITDLDNFDGRVDESLDDLRLDSLGVSGDGATFHVIRHLVGPRIKIKFIHTYTKGLQTLPMITSVFSEYNMYLVV